MNKMWVVVFCVFTRPQEKKELISFQCPLTRKGDFQAWRNDINKKKPPHPMNKKIKYLTLVMLLLLSLSLTLSHSLNSIQIVTIIELCKINTKINKLTNIMLLGVFYKSILNNYLQVYINRCKVF